MDAKVDGVAVTPRNGKAVEINSMWYNSLKIMENICKELRRKQKSKKICRTSKTNKKFLKTNSIMDVENVYMMC